MKGGQIKIMAGTIHIIVTELILNSLTYPVLASVYDYSILAGIHFSSSDQIITCLYVHQYTDPKSDKYDIAPNHNFGHSYLQLTNTYSHKVFLQGFQINPNESITVGLWGDLSSSGSSGHTGIDIETPQGIFINREAFYYSHLEIPGDSVMLMNFTTEEKLIELYPLIMEKKFEYDLVNYNCSTFAEECWQYLTGQDLVTSGLVTPRILAACIRTQDELGYFERSVQFETDRFYSYYRSSGRFKEYKGENL